MKNSLISQPLINIFNYKTILVLLSVVAATFLFGEHTGVCNVNYSYSMFGLRVSYSLTGNYANIFALCFSMCLIIYRIFTISSEE